MPHASLIYNPDGTAQVRLVDDDGNRVEDFAWVVNAIRGELGFIVRYETVDGIIGELITTVPSADMSGAHTQASQALIQRAREHGYVVGDAVLSPEEP